MSRNSLYAFGGLMLLSGLYVAINHGVPHKQVTLSKKNTLVLSGPVTPVSVAVLQMEATDMDDKLEEGAPIYLVLKTPGGSIADGLALIGTLKSLKHDVKTVTVFAASMGFEIVQQMGERMIIPGGTLMAHNGAVSGMEGEVFSTLESRVEAVHKLLRELHEIAASRMGISVTHYNHLIEHEYWVQGSRAVEEGAADTLVYAKCDASLSKVAVKFMPIGPFNFLQVGVSDCPLITSPVPLL